MITKKPGSTTTSISLADLERDSVVARELAQELRQAKTGQANAQYRTAHFAAAGGDKGKVAPPRPQR